MTSIHGGSGNELFYHGSTLLNGDGAKIDLDGDTAKYFVCAITVLAAAKFEVLNILDGGIDLGLGNTHFVSTEDTQTVDTDWGGVTAESDDDQTVLTAGGSGVEFPAGVTIYGMWDNVELHAGSVICYVAPRPDYFTKTRAAQI
tara:strand:+ start:1596 stop:2027 length:432 start_codon:yes stop_codon:yes gene_type:complete